jgi:hypothetical protein
MRQCAFYGSDILLTFPESTTRNQAKPSSVPPPEGSDEFAGVAAFWDIPTVTFHSACNHSAGKRATGTSDGEHVGRRVR